MRAVAFIRRSATVVLATVCLGTAIASPAFAGEPLPPPAVPYVVRVFGEDPLGEAGPKVSFAVDPAAPDSFFGWYRSVVTVTLSSERPAAIRYAWDDPAGQSRWYGGLPVIAPQGRHVLYAWADDGKAGPLTALEIKSDYRSPRVTAESRQALSATPQPSSSGSTSASAIVNVRVTVKPFAGPRVIRIYGADRYGTCEQIGRKDFPAEGSFAIVARGDDFPDALAAASLAGVYDCPIVLTRTTAIPAVTLKLMTDKGVRQAIVVGSERAVSGNVARQLADEGIAVQRIGGIDRYETAALIAREVVARGGERGKAFVARGDLYPDSLAVSPFAFRAKRPILLVRPTSLPSITSDTLSDLGISSVVIAGSDRAVSNDVESLIRSLSVTTSRVQGSDRYGTGIAAAEYGVANHLGDFKMVGLATGQNFPDALCGGAAIGSLGGVILMTPKTLLAGNVRDELRAHGPQLRDIQVFGSEYAVSRNTWDQLLDAIR